MLKIYYDLAVDHLSLLQASMKSDSPSATKGLHCVLPNPRSIMLICLIVGSQMYNHLANEGKLGQKAEVDAECVAHYGSVFPFCMPGTSKAAVGNLKLSSMQKADYEESQEQLQQLLEVS